MRRMRICFTYVFFCFLFSVFFCFFSVRQKNRQPFSGTAERIFMKLLPNYSGDNVVSNVVPKWGLGPQIIFWGLKTTHCALGGDAWRMNRKNYFMLVCSLRHCATTAVALQTHEGVNAFNLVLLHKRGHLFPWYCMAHVSHMDKLDNSTKLMPKQCPGTA